MEPETTFASAHLTKRAREFLSVPDKLTLEGLTQVIFSKNNCRPYRERAIINIRNANAIIPNFAPPPQDHQVGLNQDD